MNLFPHRRSSNTGSRTQWLAMLSAAIVCFFIVCLVNEEVDAQRRGFGGGGYQGGFGRGPGGGYGGFQRTPNFPPAGRAPIIRQPAAPPRMMPRQPIPGGGMVPKLTPRPLQKSITPNSPVTSLKGFSGQTTKAGSPIVQTNQGRRFAVPQKGISTSLRGHLMGTTSLASSHVNAKALQSLVNLQRSAQAGSQGKGPPIVPGGGLAAHEKKAHEKVGGHTLEKHVGKNVTDLIQRVSKNSGPPYASSFSTRAKAERAIGQAIAVNQASIKQWIASSSSEPLPINHKYDKSVGLSVSKIDKSVVRTKYVRVVLVKDAKFPEGYRINTSYPIRETQTKEAS